MRYPAAVSISAILLGCINQTSMNEGDDHTDLSVDAGASDSQVDGAVDHACAEVICESDQVCALGECIDRGNMPINSCVRVQPAAILFDAVALGSTATRALQIESCGGVPVDIISVALRDDSSPQFALNVDVELPLRLPAAIPDEPPPTHDILVEFTPPDGGEYSGAIVIETSDPARPSIETTLLGSGAQNQCPVAVVQPDLIEVVPGDIIELNGGASTDPDSPDGRPVQYHWVVTQAPNGSTATTAERFQDPRRPAETGLPDDSSTPQALFLADIAGSYTLQLSVTDGQGLTAPSDACPQPPAVVQIEATFETDIQVEMVWNTPGDDDQTDAEGADVDLHLRHPRGRNWAPSPLNCNFANRSPDWGPAGQGGNPNMVLDDADGAGPERISLNAPEDTNQFPGAGYRVGAHYFRAGNPIDGGTWGPSEVTTRVFLEGRLAGEWVSVLEDTGNFWEVADIIWTPDERRVVERNRLFDQPPED